MELHHGSFQCEVVLAPILNNALEVIIAGGGTASSAAATAAASAIHSLMMDPSFRRRSHVNDDGRNYTEEDCWKALAALGPAARQALPMLRKRIEEMWGTGSGYFSLSVLRCIGAISPEDALAYCSRILAEGGKGTYHEFEDIRRVVQVAFELGKTSIPALEKFCGIFSGYRGQIRSAAISALRNGQARFVVSPD